MPFSDDSCESLEKQSNYQNNHFQQSKLSSVQQSIIKINKQEFLSPKSIHLRSNHNNSNISC